MSERNYNDLDGDQKFWLRIWSLVATVAIVFITAIATNDLYYKHTVAKHANPVEYTCALDMPGRYVNPTCVIYWQHGDK